MLLPLTTRLPSSREAEGGTCGLHNHHNTSPGARSGGYYTYTCRGLWKFVSIVTLILLYIIMVSHPREVFAGGSGGIIDRHGELLMIP